MLVLPINVLSARSTAVSSLPRTYLYQQCIPVLATVHHEDRAVAPAFRRHLGVPVITCDYSENHAVNISDGHVPRLETLVQSATRKARFACESTGRKIGLGSDGGFSVQSSVPFITENLEVLVLHDRELGVTVTETVSSTRTNCCQADVVAFDEIDYFLSRIGFPRQGVVIGSTELWTSGPIFRGLTRRSYVQRAFCELSNAYPGELIRIATDTRANMNPKRMAVIRAAASRLALRVASKGLKCAQARVVSRKALMD